MLVVLSPILNYLTFDQVETICEKIVACIWNEGRIRLEVDKLSLKASVCVNNIFTRGYKE